ncbi:hypothetical protein RF55_15972 [Lasius niger]|uniref:Uncharacterized protein n=1 Tax=Lasius niger TaxID=67767 RepID=A0A0J7K5J0_LASNI|nr:hypothetical protein RF55_15972 [Lasius niger]
MLRSSLSQINLSATLSEEQHDGRTNENSLVEEILKVEDSIVRMSAKISSKTASLLELDAAAESALANIISLDDPRDSWQNFDRVGRARRRGGANRVSESQWQAGGSTVPEVPPSSSNEGPASSWPTGEEHETTEVDRDPLDLTFVDCLSAEVVPQFQSQETAIALTPNIAAGTKRKAKKISPDAPSEEEPGVDAGMARKLRPKKKVPPRKTGSKSSSARNDSDSEVGQKKNVSQGSNKNKKKSRARRRSVTSSDNDEDSNFAPEELRALGATAAGSLALECIDDVEDERKNSPNINGQVSGRMKRKLIRAKKVINTLVYKAEASGDPALLRLKNRELTEKVQRLKLNKVVVKRELDDMRSLVDTLREEISGLKDRVNETEEDRRKSRESQRIMLWKHKKERGEVVCESPTVLMNDTLPAKDVASENRKVDIPLESYTSRTIKGSKPSSSSAVLSVPKDKDRGVESKAKEINNQIMSLIRQRAELKRQTIEDSETGSDRHVANGHEILHSVQLDTDQLDTDQLDTVHLDT